MTVGWSLSDLVLDDGSDAEVDRWAVVASTDFFASDTLTLQIASGALLDGTLAHEGVDRTLGPGWLLSGGASWRVLDGRTGWAPFLLLSFSVGASGTRTRVDPPEAARALRGDYLAFDARFGVVAGKTFGDVFTPYVAGRVFGGPVIWSEGDETRGGTDKTHVQLAGGVSLLLGPVDVFVEGAPLGERGVLGGVGLTY